MKAREGPSPKLNQNKNIHFLKICINPKICRTEVKTSTATSQWFHALPYHGLDQKVRQLSILKTSTLEIQICTTCKVNVSHLSFYNLGLWR